MSGYPSGLTYRPIEAWPGALTPPARRRRAAFSSTLSATLGLLETEVRMMPARNVVLQIALRDDDLRRDGLPRANARPEHPGVILSMESRAGSLSYPCDSFTRWEDNLRAIALTMEKLRAIDRYGVTRNGEQYRGWLQLEQAPADPEDFATAEDALGFIRAMSGLRPEVTDSRESIAAAVRRAKRNTHPDTPGGRSEVFIRVTQAEEFLRTAGLL